MYVCVREKEKEGGGRVLAGRDEKLSLLRGGQETLPTKE